LEAVDDADVAAGGALGAECSASGDLDSDPHPVEDIADLGWRRSYLTRNADIRRRVITPNAPRRTQNNSHILPRRSLPLEHSELRSRPEASVLWHR
jgi:hypothetical protein